MRRVPRGANRGGVVALSATVANPSSAAAPASTVAFYLSTDGPITTADALLGSVVVPTLAGGAQQVVGSSVTIPATLATGTYFVGAIADDTGALRESIESNNSRPGNTVTVN